MLTPRERAILAGIEERLVIEDPAFVARLRHPGHAQRRASAALAALGVISAAALLAVLINLTAALALNQPLPAPTVVALSLLGISAAAAYAILRFVPGPGPVLA